MERKTDQLIKCFILDEKQLKLDPQGTAGSRRYCNFKAWLGQEGIGLSKGDLDIKQGDKIDSPGGKTEI